MGCNSEKRFFEYIIISLKRRNLVLRYLLFLNIAFIITSQVAARAESNPPPTPVTRRAQGNLPTDPSSAVESSSTSSPLWSRDLITPQWRKVYPISQIKVDLIFLVDGSGSVAYRGTSNFNKIKDWIKQISSAFDIANKNIRIGVIQYSHWYRTMPLHKQEYIKTEVSLDRCNDFTCFNRRVEMIKPKGYTTYTGHAINKTVKIDFASSDSRAFKVLILLTDGTSQDEIIFSSSYARSQNVTIFCVGVGDYSLSQLQIIANGELHNYWRVYELSRFGQLPSTIQDLQREVKAVYETPACTPLISPIHGKLTCTNRNEIGSVCTYRCDNNGGYSIQGSLVRNCHRRPTLSPRWTGRPATCGVCSSKFDLLVVLDSSSNIGHNNFLILKQFLLKLVDTIEIGKTMGQVSVITYSNDIRNLWEYNTFHNKNSLLQAIVDIPYREMDANMGQALYYALEHKFGVNSGRRPNSPHLTLLLTDGTSNDSTQVPSQLLKRISRVLAVGVKVSNQVVINQLASDPVGTYAVNVMGGVALLLSSVREVAGKLCNAQADIARIACPMSHLSNPSRCHSLNCTNENRAGSICSAHCCSRNVLKGIPSSSCYYDGMWSQTTWQCVDQSCVEIEAKSGLLQSCSNENKIGSVCTLSCAPGYQITGSTSEGHCSVTAANEVLSCSHTCQSSNSSVALWDFPPVICSEINECDSNPCENNSTCHDFLNNFTCDCQAGFSGVRCDINIDDCASILCLNGAECVDDTNSFRCLCRPGFMGNLCESTLEVCNVNPCLHNGTCFSMDGDYKCNCVEGYTGRNCEEISPCDPGLCLNRGVCRNLRGNFSCACSPGFRGQRCENVIDSCADEPCLNGGTCYDLDDSLACICLPGFNGLYCEKNEMQCNYNPCHNNGLCFNVTTISSSDNMNEYLCLCNPGFTGELCEVDIDECSSSPCFNNGSCTDLVAAFACHCEVGFRGSLCEINIDDCHGVHCLNNGSCEDKINDFECICQSGYGGHMCESKVNACFVGACMNDGLCYNTTTSYKCFCSPGFQGGRCQVDVDECASNPCVHATDCYDGNASFECVCSPGYEGPRCEWDIDECRSEPCRHNGRCIDLKANFACVCNCGFGGKACEIEVPCPDSSSQNSSRCNNITNCECPPGFYGDYCEMNYDECTSDPCQNAGICEDGINGYTCRCVDGFESSNCEANIDDCSLYNVTCSFNGKCVDRVNSYKCSCSPGYHGSLCEEEIDECLLLPCVNGGECVDEIDSYHCLCQDGYTGVNCQNDISECILNNPCENGAICRDKLNDFMCFCRPGYSGNRCEINIPDCRPDSCLHGGNCIDLLNSFRCECPEGFQGNRCEIDINECESNPCKHDGFCIDGTNQFACKCPPGWTGLRCERNIDECFQRPCHNGGRCVDIPGSYVCACADGYDGANCQNNINDCASAPCGNNGKCIDLIHAFRCECPGGFNNSDCLEVMNNCNSSSCLNGGQCVGDTGDFRCECAVGFSGIHCQINVDECAPAPCVNGGECMDEIASYRCVCPPGFSGLKCEMDIYDDCQNITCVHGECNDLVNGYTCNCFDGYTGPSCDVNIDECSANPCLNGAQCVDTNGSYYCSCLQGYSGNNCQNRVNPCSSTPCLNNARCVAQIDSYRCMCTRGFYGNRCELRRNFCLPNPCRNGATCVSLIEGSFVCACTAEYMGRRCEMTFQDLCYPNPCFNGGSCSVEGFIFVCRCRSGYTGNTCEDLTDNCVGGFDDKCRNGGTCVNQFNSYSCVCPQGFFGDYCENEVRCPPDVQAAAPKPVVRCKGSGNFGTVCILTCPIGTLPKSRNIPLRRGEFLRRTCLNTGIWSPPGDDMWGCKSIKCPSLTSEMTSRIGSIVSVRNGYDFALVNLTEAGFEPAMLTVSLKHKQRNVNSLYTDCSNGNEVGSRCEFSCKHGYRLSGSHMRTCLTNGQWSGLPTYCVQTACTFPTGHNLINSLSCTNGLRINSRCFITCPPGYQRFGFILKECRSDFRWHPETTWGCVATSCSGPPPTISNGVYDCSNSTNPGSICTARCFPGHRQSHRGQFTCVSVNNTFRWEGALGVCERVVCDKSIDLRTGESRGFDRTNDYAFLVSSPQPSRDRPHPDLTADSNQCDLKAVVAINDSSSAVIRIDVWYNKPHLYHLDIGDKATSNGIQRLRRRSGIRDEMTGYNDMLTTYSDERSAIRNGSVPIETTDFSTPGAYPGVFGKFDHVTVGIREGYIDLNNNRNLRGTIGPSPNFSSRNGRLVSVGFNRLANTAIFFHYRRIGSGLCFVCINSEN